MKNNKTFIGVMILLVIILVIAISSFVSAYRDKKNEEEIQKQNERDENALRVINNACDRLIDEKVTDD